MYLRITDTIIIGDNMRNKKKNRIFLLLILLLGISIGFAALATTLKINGNASITKNTWDIYWDNIANKSGVTPTTEPVISADENNIPKTLVTWGVTLDKPGDYYEFEVDAVNNGSLDAMIISIESKINNSPIKSTVNGEVVVADPSPVPSFIKYTVTYADGEEIELNHLLAKKTNNTPTRETYKIRVEYDKNAVTNSDINNQQSDTTYTFSFAVTYGQADDNARDRHASSLALGDYFTLVPNASTYTISGDDTGYSGDQTITPNELTLWRVININNDGTYDAVSEYTSSTSVYFKGANGYAKFIDTLQTIASQYAKTNYTVGTRMMGYDGQTAVITDTSNFDDTTTSQILSTTSTPTPLTGTGQEYSDGILGDTLYLKDIQLVGNVYSSDTTTYGNYGLSAFKAGTSSKAVYWLASRAYEFNWPTSHRQTYEEYVQSRAEYDNWEYYANRKGRTIDSNGNITQSSNFSEITYRGSNGDGHRVTYRDFYQDGYSVRPIITLKKNVTVDSGTGTKNDPYIFE